MDAGDELLEGEGFGEVVVGSDGEALDAGGHIGGGGDHEDAGAVAGFDDGPAHLVAVYDGQIAVQEEHVVVVHGKAFQSGIPVVHDVDGERLLTQPLGDGVGQHPLVLGDQHSHDPQSARGRDNQDVTACGYGGDTGPRLYWSPTPGETRHRRDC